MKLLLDTCAFLWIIRGKPQASAVACALFRSPANEVFLSSVSAWEIAIKYRLGKLTLGDTPSRYIPLEREKHKIKSLPLSEADTMVLERLPPLHHDPFDRMLICQAISHQMTILTPDPLIAQYPVMTSW
ncbi:MAG: type II toxin-antitoxin system VapC family toxin [Rhodocyclaceae bacterium]|nr:type II toxin-antitoxin system VapC family toxin [Rhodocyclaceae bacterium]